MTSAIETALTELSANLRRMEQRHQAVGYKFDRLYGLIDAAREELASLTEPAAQGLVIGEIDRTAPDHIYLIVDPSGNPNSRSANFNDCRDISWCADSQGGLEIKYLRSDRVGATS